VVSESADEYRVVQVAMTMVFGITYTSDVATHHSYTPRVPCAEALTSMQIIAGETALQPGEVCARLQTLLPSGAAEQAARDFVKMRGLDSAMAFSVLDNELSLMKKKRLHPPAVAAADE
jgi:hypothetical protein